MMRMLEEMTGFDFFGIITFQIFAEPLLIMERKTIIARLTSNQNTSVQLFHAHRSFKLSES